jgi:hypothetical protein
MRRKPSQRSDHGTRRTRDDREMSQAHQPQSPLTLTTGALPALLII